MNRYSSLCDDFYVNMNLSTEMDLPASRGDRAPFLRASAKDLPHDEEFLLARQG